MDISNLRIFGVGEQAPRYNNEQSIRRSHYTALLKYDTAELKHGLEHCFLIIAVVLTLGRDDADVKQLNVSTVP